MDTEPNSQVNTYHINVSYETYLKNQMGKVSRSFAVVVEYLEQPLRNHLSTAYLLCRVADNIEDCTEPSEWRLSRFNDLLTLLDNPSLAQELLSTWSTYKWQGLSPDEKALMGVIQGKELWQIYANIPSNYRKIIHHWTRTMVQGMICLNEKQCSPSFLEHQNIQIIKTQDDYDEYCFIVAGTVGHMATEMAIMFYDIGPDATIKLVETSETCGRALQKTNILKDFRKDLERGYCYIPDDWLEVIDYRPLTFGGANPDWKNMVYNNVLEELNTAIDYVLALPERAIGYRLACLLCLLPALRTNQLAAREADKLFTTNHRYKISRPVMMECMRDARNMVTNNSLIQSYGTRLLTETRSNFMRFM